MNSDKTVREIPSEPDDDVCNFTPIKVPPARKSIRCKDGSALMHHASSHVQSLNKGTSSQDVNHYSSTSPNEKHSSKDLNHYSSVSSLDTNYVKVLEDAKKCIGHGATEGAFHEEWDVQLLVECDRAPDESRVVIFCPKFLSPFLKNQEELDNAFRFVLLNMDSIVRDDPYIFIYCFLGLDWTDPSLSHMVRLAYDILPDMYSENLRQFYILHPSAAFRMSIWSFWAWMSQSLWDKIVYVKSLDELCWLVHPGNPADRFRLHRCFPQIVQCADAQYVGKEMPVSFGVPLKHLSDDMGIDFTDKTTGRTYHGLPPVLVFICEVMEREGADEDFTGLFGAAADSVYRIVECMDHGRPLEHDVPMHIFWCTLKLFLDCMPTPLFSFRALDTAMQMQIKVIDSASQRAFLLDLLKQQEGQAPLHVALYIASFLRTLCENAQQKLTLRHQSAGKQLQKAMLTYPRAAEAFASCFFREKQPPRRPSPARDVAVALTETFIRNAEDPALTDGLNAPMIISQVSEAAMEDVSSSGSDVDVPTP